MSYLVRSDKVYVLCKLFSILLGIVLGISHVILSEGDWVGGFVVFGLTFFAIDTLLALIYKKEMYMTMTSLMPEDNKYHRLLYAAFMNILLVYAIYDIYSLGGFLGFTDAR